MEQELEQIEQLLAVFDERETLMTMCNHRVAQLLTPTTLGALFELFNLPTECVVWEDFQVVESVLVIRVSITYDPAKEPSQFLTLVVPPREGASPISVEKTIQFAIPLTHVFNDKETLKTWFIEMLMDETGKKIGKSKAEPTVDPVAPPELNLTKEQIAQLLYFQKMHGSERQ